MLLDTHIFLWYIKADRRLNKKARDMIQDALEVYVSSASIWEATIKMSIGKLDIKIDEMINAIHSSGFLKLSITTEHAAATMSLSNFHRDPFDRMLIAQALTEPLTFLTADKQLKNYSSLVITI